MALSLPKKVVVEAVNATTGSLTKGYVCKLIVTRGADGELFAEAYRFDKTSPTHADATTSDLSVPPTIGVLESPTLASGDTGSFCIAGDTVAYCDADGSDIDSGNLLYISDPGITNGVAYTLTNNVALSSDNAGSASTALSGALSAAELETVTVALRGRAIDPLGGPANNGADLLVATNQGNVRVVLFGNPMGPLM